MGQEQTPSYRVEVSDVDMEEYRAGALSPDVRPGETYVRIIQRLTVHRWGHLPEIIEQEIWATASQMAHITFEIAQKLDAHYTAKQAAREA
jgi:hypothetical protein